MKRWDNLGTFPIKNWTNFDKLQKYGQFEQVRPLRLVLAPGKFSVRRYCFFTNSTLKLTSPNLNLHLNCKQKRRDSQVHIL